MRYTWGNYTHTWLPMVLAVNADKTLRTEENDAAKRRKSDRVYEAGPTAASFHLDHDSEIKALMSGVGMGKSTTCLWELMLIAMEQEPDDDGVRNTRMAIVRATYAQLKMTTIKSVLDWFPERDKQNPNRVLSIVWDSPITATIEFTMKDNTRVKSEWMFFSIDREDQLSNLLGGEFTAAWINELPEIDIPTLMSDIYERLRWPSNWTRKHVLAYYNPPPPRQLAARLVREQMPTGVEAVEVPVTGHSDQGPDGPV